MVVDRLLHRLLVVGVRGRLPPLQVSQDMEVGDQHWGREWDSLKRPGRREGELCSDQDQTARWMMAPLQTLHSDDEGPIHNRIRKSQNESISLLNCSRIIESES